jgi:hypothetical protein
VDYVDVVLDWIVAIALSGLRRCSLDWIVAIALSGLSRCSLD